MVHPQTRPDKNQPGTVWSWGLRNPYRALTLLTIIVLIPFLGRPFNIDDPLFVWAAQQIQSHPGDPYGFNVNWYGSPQPMWTVTENPPLTCYFIAVAAAIFGWNETGLHLMFLLPAIAVVLGTFRLAQKFCGLPALAALVTLFTPAFLVSSTTVMCDVPMLAFWMWAIVFWVEGIGQKKNLKLFLAGVFIALATMTKYYGVCLVPLLAAYSVAGGYKPVRRLTYLLIPLATLAAYQIIAKKVYGLALMSQASAYAGFAREKFGFSHVQSGVTALAFTGGCLAAAVFFMPLLWRKRAFAYLTGGATLFATAIICGGAFLEKYNTIPAAQTAGVKLQAIFWTVGGILLLALAVREIWEQRDAPSWLLALWIFGTFVFAAGVNWTVNARTLLPMTPAVGILLARCWERRTLTGEKPDLRPATGILVTGALLALLVTHSDFSLAVAARQSANEVQAKYGAKNGTLWFDGNWGFQYYLQKLGVSALDVKDPQLKAGDILALPLNNSILRPPDAGSSTMLDAIIVPVDDWVTTWNLSSGAGFYAATVGPLPFAFGRVTPQYVCIFSIHEATPKPVKNPQ